MMRLAAGVAAAKAVGTLARTAGRGGGTSLPGKVLTRVEPHAIGRLAQRLDRGSVVISATNGKTTTAAMVASILERTGARLVHNRAGANMAGGIASALASASRKGGRALTGDFGLFEVDEFWLGPVVEELEPRAMLLGNLYRDQLDRYGELETIADRWAAWWRRRSAGRRSCSTRTTRSSPIWAASEAAARRARRAVAAPPRSCPTRSTSASTTTRSRSPSSSTRRTPSTAGAAGTRTPTRRSTSRTSATTTARTAARRARSPTSSRTDVELRGIRSAAFTLRGRRVELPLPGPLQRLQRARGGGADAQPRRRARRRRRGPAGRRARVRPRRDARPRRPADLACCWSRTRPAPTRCCGRSRWRRTSSTCSASSTTGSPTAATSAGSGTPTGSCWSAACAASRARARAPPSWRCG